MGCQRTLFGLSIDTTRLNSSKLKRVMMCTNNMSWTMLLQDMINEPSGPFRGAIVELSKVYTLRIIVHYEYSCAHVQHDNI